MSTTTEKRTIFGERLKTELERQEMSLRQFAEKAGLTLTTACRYVHSQRTPRATEILKAAKVLGVTCDYMLGLSDDPHKTRDGWAKAGFHELPSAQPETHDKRTKTHSCDCISRQDAIDAVYKCDDIFVGDMPVMVVKADAYEALAQLPSAQPDLSGYSDKLWKKAYERGKAEAQQRWIPCSERLPEETGQYLITVKYVHVDGYDDIYAEHGEWTDGKWDMFCFGHCGKVENIIAWMPLPEPYAERRTDEAR